MAKPIPKKDFRVFLWMLAVIVIPAFLALRSVNIPGELVFHNDPNSKYVSYAFYEGCQKKFPPNCTPHGYTWSMLLFIAPSLTIWYWLHFSFKNKVVKKSFWLTIGILFPIGCLSDMALTRLFFCFPNQGATLGINLPGYDFHEGRFWLNIPIEETVLYASGFMAILSFYMWCDEHWYGAYNISHYDKDLKAKVSGIEGILRPFHFSSILIGIILIIGAVLYKKFGPHEYQNGFPGYFTFLVAASVVPASLLFNTAYSFINWRAFSTTFFYVLLISMMWQATLAVPYGWWRYRPDQMMGLLIKPWSGLPVEAAMLWLSVTFTTTIVYTMIKIWLISGKPFMKFLWGKERIQC